MPKLSAQALKARIALLQKQLLASENSKAPAIKKVKALMKKLGVTVADLNGDQGAAPSGRGRRGRKPGKKGPAKGRKVAATVKQALVVPGSGLVKAQAEAEGLDKIFIEAGFEWREPGCSMCLAMNPDKLGSGEHCASTSNRNFEGRQGAGGRTHLVSPAMAAAAAVTGRFIDVRELIQA